MQIIRREIRPQPRAVTENGAIFHQPVFEKNFLAGDDVLAGEQNLSVRVHDFGRNRRLVGVGVIREQPHHKESEEHDECHRLNPAFGNQQTLFYHS